MKPLSPYQPTWEWEHDDLVAPCENCQHWKGGDCLKDRPEANKITDYCEEQEPKE